MNYLAHAINYYDKKKRFLANNLFINQKINSPVLYVTTF